MKKYYLFLIPFLFALALTASAQTQKGALLLGGAGSFNFEKNFLKQYQASLSPRVGYFVANNLAVGLGLEMTYSKIKSDQYNRYGYPPYHIRSLSAGISPFVRYYIGNSSTRFFAQAAPSFSRSWSNRTVTSEQTISDATNFISASGGVGVVHFITEQVGLEAFLDYTHTLLPAVEPSTKRLGFNVGLQFYLPGSN